MSSNAPEASVVRTVAGKYLSNITSVERVSKGWSTYVYRVISDSNTYYIRFLPEDASFAAEALAHNTEISMYRTFSIRTADTTD